MRSSFQRVVGGEELRRRIHHGRVEKLFEQFVAQVVVGSNVFLRTLARVAIEPVQGANQRPTESRQPTLQCVEHLKVTDEDAHHGGQVRGAPVAMDKRFARTNRTIAGHQAPGCRIKDVDLSQQRAARTAKQMPLALFDDQQLAVFQVRQLPQYATAQQ